MKILRTIIQTLLIYAIWDLLYSWKSSLSDKML